MIFVCTDPTKWEPSNATVIYSCLIFFPSCGQQKYATFTPNFTTFFFPRRSPILQAWFQCLKDLFSQTLEVSIHIRERQEKTK